MLRGLVITALALTMLIVGASAFVRLSQQGLSCADWPACYSQERATPAPSEELSLGDARMMRRFAASGAGILILVLAVLGWDSWRGDRRRAVSVATVALVLGLAWLGRYTPSAVPAVALGNVLGGMVLLGLLFSMRRSLKADEAVVPRALVAWAWIALLAVALQITLGTLIGERHGALACSHFVDCALWPAGASWEVFDPFRTNEGLNEASLQALHGAHFFGAAAVTLVLAWTALLHARMQARRWFHGAALLLLTGTQLALGAAVFLTGRPITVVVAHNVVAALLVAVLLDAVVRLSAREAR